VSTIRTAHAFGTQHALASLYNVAIQKAYQAECRFAVAQGVGLGMFFFCIYAAYGLGEFDFLVYPPAQLIPAIDTQHSALAPRSSTKVTLVLARLSTSLWQSLLVPFPLR
jgi:hypothetical protein